MCTQVLFWDRVYLVLSLSSYSLRDFVDLPAWFHDCCLPLMSALLLPLPQVHPTTHKHPARIHRPSLLMTLLHLQYHRPATAPPPTTRAPRPFSSAVSSS